MPDGTAEARPRWAQVAMSEKAVVALGPLECIGRGDLVSLFYFEAHHDEIRPEEWEFNVWPNSVACEEALLLGSTMESFYLHLVPFGDGLLRVQMINDNNQPWAIAKGIGPALLVKARTVTGRRIVSSVSFDPTANERRENDATKMWEGMVFRGQAIRLEVDRFEVLA